MASRGWALCYEPAVVLAHTLSNDSTCSGSFHSGPSLIVVPQPLRRCAHRAVSSPSASPSVSIFTPSVRPSVRIHIYLVAVAVAVAALGAASCHQPTPCMHRRPLKFAAATETQLGLTIAAATRALHLHIRIKCLSGATMSVGGAAVARACARACRRQARDPCAQALQEEGEGAQEQQGAAQHHPPRAPRQRRQGGVPPAAHLPERPAPPSPAATCLSDLAA